MRDEKKKGKKTSVNESLLMYPVINKNKKGETY